jgi:hypothetical protein
MTPLAVRNLCGEFLRYVKAGNPARAAQLLFEGLRSVVGLALEDVPDDSDHGGAAVAMAASTLWHVVSAPLDPATVAEVEVGALRAAALILRQQSAMADTPDLRAEYARAAINLERKANQS